ncbi:hypothetical protein DP43_5694 [Burkholderia pseudomallei]|nr:hypothetical protein DP43_5694 [Burkholderia pseudomallei]
MRSPARIGVPAAAGKRSTFDRAIALHVIRPLSQGHGPLRSTRSRIVVRRNDARRLGDEPTRTAWRRDPPGCGFDPPHRFRAAAGPCVHLATMLFRMSVRADGCAARRLPVADNRCAFQSRSAAPDFPPDVFTSLCVPPASRSAAWFAAAHHIVVAAPPSLRSANAVT